MAARRGRGSTAVRVIFSQHAEILQYSRKTITARFWATDRLDALYTSTSTRLSGMVGTFEKWTSRFRSPPQVRAKFDKYM